jgi:hypothetical protein
MSVGSATHFLVSSTDLASILPVAYGSCNSNGTGIVLQNCTVTQTSTGNYTITVSYSTYLKGIIVGSANNTGSGNRGYTFSTLNNSNPFQVVIYNGSADAADCAFSFIIY